MESFNSIIRAICIKKGRGNFFTLDDFKKYVSYVSLRTELVNLVDKRFLIRIARGIYFFPHLIDGRIPIQPTFFEFVDWFAKTEKIICYPSAETAMYLVGLSSKKPESLLFFTDGGKRHLTLKQGEFECITKTTKKITSFSSSMVASFVVAMENLRENGITDDQLTTIRKFVRTIPAENIEKDNTQIPNWLKLMFRISE